jgi:hypothetical protein
MTTFASRRGAAEKLSLPLMILAFVVVGGFLYWLNVTAQPTEVAIVETEDDSAEGASAILDAADFLTGPAQYEGQLIEVTNARVSSKLGTQAFWIGPDDSPFLVKMAPSLLETGGQVLTEQVVTLIGKVFVMTDSALTAWDSLGAFSNEGDRIVAEFAVGSPFLEVQTVRARTPAGGNTGEGG